MASLEVTPSGKLLCAFDKFQHLHIFGKVKDRLRLQNSHAMPKRIFMFTVAPQIDSCEHVFVSLHDKSIRLFRIEGNTGNTLSEVASIRVVGRPRMLCWLSGQRMLLAADENPAKHQSTFTTYKLVKSANGMRLDPLGVEVDTSMDVSCWFSRSERSLMILDSRKWELLDLNIEGGLASSDSEDEQ